MMAHLIMDHPVSGFIGTSFGQLFNFPSILIPHSCYRPSAGVEGDRL